MEGPTTSDSSAGRADGAPRGDSPDRGQRILVILGAFGHKAHEALVEQSGNPDLVTNAQVLIVCELALRGPLRPMDLQVSATLTSGGTTRLLDRLEELGIIERAYGQVDGDRRGILVSLTPEGREAAARMSAALEGSIDAVRALNKELTGLLEE